MGRGNKVGLERTARRSVQPKEKGSDESDEEYKLGEDEEFDDSDENCSLDTDESEEILANYEDDEEEEKNVKRKVRSKPAQKSSRRRKTKRVKRPRKKRRVSPKVEDDEVEEEDDDDYEDEDEDEDLDTDESEKLLEDFEEDEEEENYVKSIVRSKPAQKSSPQRKTNRDIRPRKKRRVSPKIEDDDVEEGDDYEDEGKDRDTDEDEEEDEDEDEDEDENEDEDEDEYEVEDEDEIEDEDDEEFILDESACVDEEDEMPFMKKNKKVSRSHSEKRRLSKGKKRSRNKALKKPSRQISRKNRRLTRKTNSLKNAEVTNKSIVVQERSRYISSRRKRRIKEDSDSDFVSLASSDVEYTISEEEREQVREATKICTNFNTSSRSSSSIMRLPEKETACPQRRRIGRKGKEKVVDMKSEAVKQVCGICLSEEGNKTVRGSLDCCSHYFCFACIMEWSKVESRCPLCKQRFMTISKPARSNTGFELRTVVIQVPERDQVYQPSEEELQGYLDPYESVICTECQQGGEDALMLLCDICDSPAHTFCVGLGHEVPEGNWYCEGCRPAAFASLNPQCMSPTPDQRANNTSGLSSPFHGGIDLNAAYVPETPLTHETRNFSSFRRPMGDYHGSSPVSGMGASTVFDRRRVINSIRNNRTSQANIRSNGISASSPGVTLFGSRLDQSRDPSHQRTVFETAAPLYSNNEGRLEGNAFAFAHNRDQVQNQTSTSAVGSLRVEHGVGMGFNSSLVHEQLHPCTSRSNVGADAIPSPFAFREVSHFNVENIQVQQMVISHLKSLSRGNELGNSTFKNIARQSTHTVLAACGLEHRASEVCPVQSFVVCNHQGVAGREVSLMKDNCSSCFNLFVKDVVTQIHILSNVSISGYFGV